MTSADLLHKLAELRSLPGETEVVEFKEAKNQFDFSKLGKYFSALSNEANLKNQHSGWLIFGIADKGKRVVGTNFRPNRTYLDHLKSEIANKTTNRITFLEIYELQLPEGRVILFQIPAAPRGIPTAWENHYYGRDGEELGALNIEEIERIRAQQVLEDWSAGICPEATLDDLDPLALERAKVNYLKKNPRLAGEMQAWDDLTFLNKAKLAIRGKITRSAILLLGRSESEHFISPAVARITWVLKSHDGSSRDYEHFSCPFLLTVDEVFKKIRILKYRYMTGENLFPEEIDQYDPYVIREALHNCIAHQDYAAGGKIILTEGDHELAFSNMGSFLPGSVEAVIHLNAPHQYRNPFLANAMVSLNMIDTIGSGIINMFEAQRTRFFPMPEYELGGNLVKMTLYGRILEINFARLLAQNPSLSLKDIFLLDKVQKKRYLSDTEVKYLKTKGYIEGRKPNYLITAHVIKPTLDKELKAQYIRQRGFDDEHYKKMILEYLRKYGSATRKDVDELLLSKLPDVLNEKQKQNKVMNILSDLRRQGQVKNVGSKTQSKWMLCD
jgi:ATP-dependent DNA helicase RecG